MPLSFSLMCGMQNRFGRFFCDHVHRADREKTGNAREYRRVGNAKPARSMHPEVAIDHAAMLRWSDRTRARCVVSPGVVANVVRKSVGGLNVRPGRTLFGDDPAGNQRL